jgi:copper(I)-binding protein
MPNRKVRIALAACAMVMACGAEVKSASPDLDVDDAWVRATTVGSNSAAYLIVHNSGQAPDRLLGGSAEFATATELHRTTIDEAGMALMGRVEGLDLAAGATVVLEPGSYHLMLMGVTRNLRKGDTVSLVLEFETAGQMTVQAEVRSF